jgi:hypothetical protein
MLRTMGRRIRVTKRAIRALQITGPKKLLHSVSGRITDRDLRSTNRHLHQ